MQVDVLLFAALREALGNSRLTLTLDPGARAGVVLAELNRRLPERSALIERSALAINLEYSDADTALNDGDTVAVIPPVSGGQSETVEL